jgi:hypothetical protein
MSEQDPDDTLGRKPEPEIEPGEPNPGGADAIDAADGVDGERAQPDPDPRDLDPADNPAVEDVLPDDLTGGEDTETEATKGEGDDVQVDQDKESPA